MLLLLLLYPTAGPRTYVTAAHRPAHVQPQFQRDYGGDVTHFQAEPQQYNVITLKATNPSLSLSLFLFHFHMKGFVRQFFSL